MGRPTGEREEIAVTLSQQATGEQSKQKPSLAHRMDGFSVGHQAKGVLENAPGVEERQGNTHDALQLFLGPAQPGSSGVPHLIEHFILPEREDWHQVSSTDSCVVALRCVTD